MCAAHTQTSKWERALAKGKTRKRRKEKRFRDLLDFLDTDWHQFCFSPVTGRLWVASSDKIWVETVLKQPLSPEELRGLAACPKKKRKREDD